MKAFTTDYLEKVVEPCDWLALWCTDGFDVLVEVGPSFYIVKDVDGTVTRKWEIHTWEAKRQSV